jgi:ferrochelatase
MPFLEQVSQGRGIPRDRLLTVARHYETMGGASPINEITRRQAEALRVSLQRNGKPFPVYIGQLFWPPLLEDALRQMAQDGLKRAIGFVTAAHRCEASWDRYRNAVEEARQHLGTSAPVVEYVGPWFDHPLFIEAIVARVEQALQTIPAGSRDDLAWIFTAHSIPCTMAKASSYEEELQTTAQRVAEKFRQKDWTLAYCSRSGNPQDPWLTLGINDAIREQASRGARTMFVIPIGFTADHVEVLFDLDVEAKETAQKLNVGFYRARTVGDHPSFIRMIADVIQRHSGVCR